MTLIHSRIGTRVNNIASFKTFRGFQIIYSPYSVSRPRGISSFPESTDAKPNHAAPTPSIKQVDTISRAALTDSFNRVHTYLRISLTERCNLRCTYCMPAEGIELTPSAHLLTNDEIIRLASLFVRAGVTKIRLTGGEPTVRKDLVEVVGKLNQLRPLGLQTLAMTSNGVVLKRKLEDLVHNGLTHLNLSLDTLDPLKFQLLSRRPAATHGHVLATLDAALLLLPKSLKSLKVNVVLMRGVNDDELTSFAELTRTKPISVRFIEFMPFTGNRWNKDKMIPSSEVLRKLKGVYQGIQAVETPTGIKQLLDATAREHHIPGYVGSIGFISSMSDHFCGTCNRLRITADGQIKVCLFDPKEVSLRDLLRSGATDDELMQVISRAVMKKKARHAGMEHIDVVKNREMIKIGLRAKPTVSRFNITYPLLTSPVKQGETPISARYFSTSAVMRGSPKLSHIGEDGKPNMVDVSKKETTTRTATAKGNIKLNSAAFSLLNDQTEISSPSADEQSLISKARHKAGGGQNVLITAQLAGIMAAKSTSSLIPLCHPLPLTHVDIDFSLRKDEGKGEDWEYNLECMCTVRCAGRTGVEMEALTGVSVTLLTIWDMLKSVAGKEMVIENIRVIKKTGGKSGDFERQ